MFPWYSTTPTQSPAHTAALPPRVLLGLNKSTSHHLFDERWCSGSSTLSESAADGAALSVGVLQKETAP